VSGLVLTGVRAAYGEQEVLRGIDLTVPAGELLVVLGPSGSGKSTLLRVVAGLEPVTAGSIHLAGRDVTRLRPGRRNVSMVFQSYALFPHLSVRDNIMFGLRARGARAAAARRQAERAAATAGCAGYLDRRPAELSGGERQRVALARALAREPSAYLLDEPLSNLVAELRVQTRDELKALLARVGQTMLHVTHDQTEALLLGDRVAVLRAGLVEQVGTPADIWSTPATLAVARFVGSPAMNVLAETSPLAVATLPAGAAEGCQVGIRPDAVQLVPRGVDGLVSRVDVAGADAYVHVLIGADDVVARTTTQQRPAPGERVRVRVDLGEVHLFDAGTGARVSR